MSYDTSKLANFGRDAARSFSMFLRAEQKLCDEINEALNNGVTPIKVTHDVMGRCATRELQVDLMSALFALAEMGRIPKTVVAPFEEGIRVRRL